MATKSKHILGIRVFSQKPFKVFLRGRLKPTKIPEKKPDPECLIDSNFVYFLEDR